MYAHINGIVADKAENTLVIDCGGVGYLMTVSGATLALAPSVGEKMKCFTHLSVREEEDTKLLVDVVEPLVQLPPPEEPMSDIERAKRSPVKLYLRMQRSQMDEVKEVLQRQPGKVPVYMNFPDEGITLLAPRDWWCEDAEDMLATLMTTLPEKDMKVVDKR